MLGDGTRLQEAVDELLTPERRPPPVSTARYEARRTFDSELGSIAYWSTGNGAPVLLVHGWEGTHADLDAFVEPFAARGARVVSLDLPAHGESAGTLAGLPDFATAIGALGGMLGPLAAVIAHSAGCPGTALAMQRGLATARAAFVSTPTSYERWARGFASEIGVDGDALVAALIARGIDVPSLDMVKTVAGFAVPGLLVHSADDRVTDARGSRAVAAAWPGSRLLAVDGLGHSRILRDPAVVAEIVEFALTPT